MINIYKINFILTKKFTTMVEKPLTAKIVSLLKEVIAILKDEKSEEVEVQPIEPPKPEDDKETEEDKKEPIEPEINSGVAGF